MEQKDKKICYVKLKREVKSQVRWRHCQWNVPYGRACKKTTSKSYRALLVSSLFGLPPPETMANKVNNLLAQMTVALCACHNWHTIVRSKSSINVNVIWKPLFDFLLVINHNLGPILHRLATIHPLQKTTDDDGALRPSNSVGWSFRASIPIRVSVEL